MQRVQREQLLTVSHNGVSKYWWKRTMCIEGQAYRTIERDERRGSVAPHKLHQVVNSVYHYFICVGYLPFSWKVFSWRYLTCLLSGEVYARSHDESLLRLVLFCWDEVSQWEPFLRLTAAGPSLCAVGAVLVPDVNGIGTHSGSDGSGIHPWHGQGSHSWERVCCSAENWDILVLFNEYLIIAYSLLM